ncbi:MAG TPA: rhodanese-like domain-containing protein [Saprospiraceae bacterium]|nr:rhodanese-like domain-containing protein [Saprospiraceae bacterium]
MSKIGEFLYTIYAIQRYSTQSSITKIFNSKTIAQLPAKEYLQRIDDMPDALVVDLRTPLEYKISHHPRAININFLYNFKSEIAQLDTTKPIFITCLTAHRSPYAALLLKNLGFKEIYDLKGGFLTIRKMIEVRDKT